MSVAAQTLGTLIVGNNDYSASKTIARHYNAEQGGWGSMFPFCELLSLHTLVDRAEGRVIHTGDKAEARRYRYLQVEAFQKSKNGTMTHKWHYF